MVASAEDDCEEGAGEVLGDGGRCIEQWGMTDAIRWTLNALLKMLITSLEVVCDITDKIEDEKLICPKNIFGFKLLYTADCVGPEG